MREISNTERASTKKRLARARWLQTRGHFDKAITIYEQVILGTLEGEAQVFTVEDNIVLREAVEQILQLLRWTRNYSRSLILLERLGIAAPNLAKAFELDEATLTIAGGMIEAGLSKLRHMIDTSPDNIYIRAALGAELISLGRYDEAEATLQGALALQDTLPVDRAEIYELLFHLYRRTPDVYRAESAWVECCALDPARTERRSEVIRMFIYWRYFERAMNYTRQETNIGQQYFYMGLCEFNIGRAPNTIKSWCRLADWRVEAVSDCPDEFAEACLYLNKPRNTIAVLRPLIDAGQVNVWRLFLLGLAYALMIDLASAKHFLDISLRLADSARPRESRFGTGRQIVHGGMARETYGRIITATDLRGELDAFFIPLPTNASREIIS